MPATHRFPTPCALVLAFGAAPLMPAAAAVATGDLVVDEIGPGFVNWATETHRAYAVARTSCNLGDAPLAWSAANNQHPVFGQNMFRLKDGRFEQIGQAWLHHGFCALDMLVCGSCQPVGCSGLGVGCSTVNSASMQGDQSSAGPKYEVNATTGAFPYPPASPSYSDPTERRLRVRRSDVTASENPGALYFIEGQYVHPEDAPAGGGGANNASYRRVVLTQDGAIQAFAGATVMFEPAIDAWAAADAEVHESTAVIPGEGRLVVASRADDQGDGTWAFEYAVQNLDVDRAVGTFAVPVPPGATPSALGFHDVDYHSGEIWDGTDWPGDLGGGEIRWHTTPFDEDPNANALRWGTLYNFRFTAAAPPAEGTVRLSLFKPGSPDEVVVDAIVPANACAADLSGNDAVDFADVLLLLGSWGPCAGCPADLDGDAAVGFADLLQLLGEWGACP